MTPITSLQVSQKSLAKFTEVASIMSQPQHLVSLLTSEDMGLLT